MLSPLSLSKQPRGTKHFKKQFLPDTISCILSLKCMQAHIVKEGLRKRVSRGEWERGSASGAVEGQQTQTQTDRHAHTLELAAGAANTQSCKQTPMHTLTRIRTHTQTHTYTHSDACTHAGRIRNFICMPDRQQRHHRPPCGCLSLYMFVCVYVWLRVSPCVSAIGSRGSTLCVSQFRVFCHLFSPGFQSDKQYKICGNFI